MVVKEDNKVELRRISAGEEIEKDIVVTKGLSAGEKIVIDGLQKIKQGSVVNPGESKPSDPSLSESVSSEATK